MDKTPRGHLQKNKNYMDNDSDSEEENLLYDKDSEMIKLDDEDDL